MRVALDTTYIPGRGAVKITCNRLADGILKVMHMLAAVAHVLVRRWAERGRVQALRGIQREGRGGHQLLKPAGAAEDLGAECCRCWSAAGIGPAGSGKTAF